MISFDTNLVVYSANAAAPEQGRAAEFLTSLAERQDVVICELMLVEVYLKLRNAAIIRRPLDAAAAAAYCQTFRKNPNWHLVEGASVMDEVWRQAASKNFAVRRIIDARLALTLRHHGVTEFATTNQKDFAGFGFARVWNPLSSR
ncbi:MAG TPA: TA system VapC family ribonuclease toxin [Clostridia bacterium]|nr:TA system VapC family ribonuclease toxin [Clostridia bacterium]